MKFDTLYVKNTSQELLNLVTKLKADKEDKVKALLFERNNSEDEINRKSIEVVTVNQYFLHASNELHKLNK